MLMELVEVLNYCLNSIWIINRFRLFKKQGNCQIAANVTSLVDWTCHPKLEDHDRKLIRRFETWPNFLKLTTESVVDRSCHNRNSKQKILGMTEFKCCRPKLPTKVWILILIIQITNSMIGFKEEQLVQNI